MNLLPKSYSEFSKESYWDEFFKIRGTKAFEWYGEYPQLCEILLKYLRPKDHFLVMGCGNSTLSADLYDSGYCNSVSIDISDVVIQQMKKKYAQKYPDLKFQKMDMLQTTFSDGEFSVVLDKGTLDALMADDSLETREKVDKLFTEISRLLKLGGRYVCISLLQHHILKKLVHWFSAEGWMIRIQRCIDAEECNESKESSPVVFPVFVVICTKLQKLATMKSVLEVSLTGKGHEFERMDSVENVINSVQSLQHYALLKHRLNTRNLVSGENVSFELHVPNCPHPRYTLYVVDTLLAQSANKKFAIFITPQGRETEWLFGTAQGQKQLAKSAQFQRLVVVHLNRNHQYAGLDEVKAELSSKVMELAPKGMNPSADVPFLSIGDDVGKREVRYKGTSEFSGEFVVEDVACDGGQVFRRLVFMSNQTLIQSEAKIRSVGRKKKKGSSSAIIDHSYLACTHHSFMVAGLAFIAPKTIDTEAEALLIGLGGGPLASYITQYLKKVSLLAVDIDQSIVDVAKNWFDLKTGNGLTVRVADGLTVIKEAVQQGLHYDAVLLDVDSKDQSVGMSCPPESFVQIECLKQMATLVSPNGIVILNLVCRDESLKKCIYDHLSEVFPSIMKVPIPEEVNEVVYAMPNKDSQKPLMELEKQVERLVKQIKVQTRNDVVDVAEMMANLQIDASSR